MQSKIFIVSLIYPDRPNANNLIPSSIVKTIVKKRLSVFISEIPCSSLTILSNASITVLNKTQRIIKLSKYLLNAIYPTHFYANFNTPAIPGSQIYTSLYLKFNVANNFSKLAFNGKIS